MDGGLWRGLGVDGVFFGGVVMRRDPEPCSCRLARSGLGENRQLTSVPSVLLRPMAGASVIVGHLEGVKVGGGEGGDHRHNTLPPHSHLHPTLTPGLRVTQLLHPLMLR